MNIFIIIIIINVNKWLCHFVLLSLSPSASFSVLSMHFYCICIVHLVQMFGASVCVCVPSTIKCKCDQRIAFKIYFHRNDNYNKQTINSCCWLNKKYDDDDDDDDKEVKRRRKLLLLLDHCNYNIGKVGAEIGTRTTAGNYAAREREREERVCARAYFKCPVTF